LSVITLDYGAADPLVLEVTEGTILADCRGPQGAQGTAARSLVEAATTAPAHGPPLAAHVVPGDRVLVAVAGHVPQAGDVVTALSGQLAGAGIAPDDIAVLHAAALDEGSAVSGSLPPGVTAFDPALDSATSYLAADADGRPLYLARNLVDADVVVAVGNWDWDAALGGRALNGELWPAFSRQACRRELVTSLARRGRKALADWKAALQEITWQLGVCASLRLVAGSGGTLHAACFGLPDEAAHRARAAAAGWCPRIDEPVELAVATLSDPAGGFGAVTRAVAAAARVTRPDGTICLASRVSAGPGILFLRWRQGAPLEKLVHEALATQDPQLVADALQARLFARALGDRRLVLLSDMAEDTVEELEFGSAGSPEVVERLAHRSDSLAVLHEADRMLPNAGC
jgi:hypothetical protein